MAPRTRSQTAAEARDTVEAPDTAKTAETVSVPKTTPKEITKAPKKTASKAPAPKEVTSDGAARKAPKKAEVKEKKHAAAVAAALEPRRSSRIKIDRVPKALLARFDGYTVAQIKTELVMRELTISGIKQDLFMRLVEAENHKDDDDHGDDDDDDDVDVEDAPTEEDSKVDDDVDVEDAPAEQSQGKADDAQDNQSSSSLPDYESDPSPSQQPAAGGSDSGGSGGSEGSKGIGDQKPEATPQPASPTGPIDCVQHCRRNNLASPRIRGEADPRPHHFFIPNAALDTTVKELYNKSDINNELADVLGGLGQKGSHYLNMKLRDALQYHMPERYLIARISKRFDDGCLESAPFEKVSQSQWGKKLPQDWRMAKVMTVLDAAPAFLREWSAAIDANKFPYPYLPTNYAEDENHQWYFGRVLLFTPGLLDLFKQLVRDGKLELPSETDTTDVTDCPFEDKWAA